MATGKTNATYMRAYFDEIDMSGDARGIGSIGIEYDEHDATGWSDAITHYTIGRPRAVFDGFQALMNNTANTGAFTELKAREMYLVSLHLGIRAAPAVGDPAWCCPLENSSLTIEGSGSLLMSANMVGPVAVAATNVLQEKVWGRVLCPLAARTATYTGTSIDFGAANTAGMFAIMHLTAVDAGDTWTFKVQHSTNDADWADVSTFALDGQTLGAEQDTVATAVNQYVRFLATMGGSGSGASFCCTFIRR